MSDRVNEIKLDIEDLNSLLEQATRQKSKDLLTLEIRRLQTELINDAQNSVSTNKDSEMPKPSSNKNAKKCYDVKLNNYAWDQTDVFVKLYVSLSKVQSLPKEAVFCKFEERSIDLHILGLDNKNYIFPINNLAEEIDAKKSKLIIKTDLVILCLAKKSKKTWTCITSIEKRLKDAKSTAPLPDESSDPSASLMSMMKKMYDEGDDELKRTIAKAWTEGQEKKAAGVSPHPMDN